MPDYSDKLQDRRWAKKRNRIFRRDNYKCTVCGNSETLEVHHQFYYSDYRDPWKYPDTALITVCMKCHNEYHFHHEHEIREVNKNKPKQVKKRKKKKVKKRKKLKMSLADYQEIRGLRVKPRI